MAGYVHDHWQIGYLELPLTSNRQHLQLNLLQHLLHVSRLLCLSAAAAARLISAARASTFRDGTEWSLGWARSGMLRYLVAK